MTTTRNQLLKNIKRLVDAIEMHESITAPLEFIPESKIHEAFYEAINLAIEGFGKESKEWVEWFIWENDKGANGMTAGYDNKLKPIKTVDDLVDLIIKDEV